MSISSVSSQSLIAQLLAIQNYGQTSSTTSAADLFTSDAGTDQASISGPGALMSQLQQLQTSDPDAFKETVQKIADQLAEEAKNADDPRKAQFLSDMAAKFSDAADSGDMSALAPPPPPDGQKPQGGVAGGYGKNGKANAQDLFADVNSIISNALASALGSASDETQTLALGAVA